MRTVIFCSIAVLGVGVGVGCTDKPDEERPNRGVAVVSRTATAATTFVFLNEVNTARVPEILAGEAPNGFQWLAVHIPGARANELNTSGVTIDLAQADGETTFAQSYSGSCNPALDVRGPCWLSESYAAGESGLSGSVALRVTEGTVLGGLEVSWTGITDRFGAPAQHLTHNTSAPVAAVITSLTEESP